MEKRLLNINDFYAMYKQICQHINRNHCQYILNDIPQDVMDDFGEKISNDFEKAFNEILNNVFKPSASYHLIEFNAFTEYHWLAIEKICNSSEYSQSTVKRFCRMVYRQLTYKVSFISIKMERK